MPAPTTRSIIIRWSIIVLLFFLLLFIPSGRLFWLEAWLFILAYIAAAVPLIIWLKKNDPKLLEQRMEFLRIPSRSWDKIILLLWAALFVAIFVTAGLDERFNWSQAPIYTKILGFLGFIPAAYLFFVTFKENAFATRTVEVEKSQKVISTGPYAFVRHPLYLGAIIFFISIPFFLGSFYALIPASMLFFVIIARTYLEDETLRKELNGYEDYTKKTRYKLFPGIW